MSNHITTASIDDFFASWVTAPWSILAVDDTYVWNVAHTMLDDVDAGKRLGTLELASRTISDGVFDADNALIPTAGGDNLGGFWIFNDTGTESTSRLMLWIDRNSDGTPISGLTDSAGIMTPFNAAGIFRIAAVGS